MNFKMIRLINVLLLIFMCMGTNAHDKYKEILDLSGKWRFSIGDNKEWASTEFDDSDWETIDVPKRWENEGFYGYDGYAWYRTKFELGKEYENLPMFLSLGYIDDVDEVFFNGVKIGRTGSFPPYYSTAYNAKRFYLIPSDLMDEKGFNTIAVRVFDEGGEGGIVHGNVSIVADLSAIPVDYCLQGKWSFITEDINISNLNETDFMKWDKIMVPDMWENQGYKNYDGIATYAVKFPLSNEFLNDKMVLILGRIDDIEQVYLNGELVAQFGELNRKTAGKYDNAHRQLRGYYLDDNVLNNDGENILVVKVYDNGGIGGIYQGSVGLITQDNYIKHWNRKRRM